MGLSRAAQVLPPRPAHNVGGRSLVLQFVGHELHVRVNVVEEELVTRSMSWKEAAKLEAISLTRSAARSSKRSYLDVSSSLKPDDISRHTVSALSPMSRRAVCVSRTTESESWPKPTIAVLRRRHDRQEQLQHSDEYSHREHTLHAFPHRLSYVYSPKHILLYSPPVLVQIYGFNLHAVSGYFIGQVQGHADGRVEKNSIALLPARIDLLVFQVGEELIKVLRMDAGLAPVLL